MGKNEKITFALDIGTRSIVGIVLEAGKETLTIKEMVMKEHTNRSMVDGQIHSIPEVSALVKEIKGELEKRTGLKLKNVAVAAAGRSLKTVKTTIHQDFSQQITKDDVLKLELSGAQEAQRQLLKENGDLNYYCVGYSVTNYLLDGAVMGNLVGQKGQTGGVELVAAFLPKIVVDSLQTVLEDNKLKLANITLEPIAAINVILPPSMRKLNIALVDVGAGTSDIAISANGSIIAYGMVPIAGDEITEFLSEKYLLDFYEGERVKRLLAPGGTVAFTDILGFEHELPCDQIIESLAKPVDHLAKEIAQEILELNNKPPQAVLLIGGGSQTPLLTSCLAHHLGLTKERVAVQRAAAVKEVANLPQDFTGPEIVTPLGIAITALRHGTLGFITIQVNGQAINLLNMGSNKVADGLLSVGLTNYKVYGRPGLALSYELNGQTKLIPGTFGQPAIIKVNGQPATLATPLKPKDKIDFIPAQDGQRGQGNIGGLLPTEADSIYVNGQKKELPYEITMNGAAVTKDTSIMDNSKIYLRQITQIGELLSSWQLISDHRPAQATLIIEDKEEAINLSSLEIKSQDRVLELYDHVEPGMELTIGEPAREITIGDIMDKYLGNIEAGIQVTVNGSQVNVATGQLTITLNGGEASPGDNLGPGDRLELGVKGASSTPLLLDVFKTLDFPTTNPPGTSRLGILINGEEGEYTSLIKEGDNIELLWQ